MTTLGIFDAEQLSRVDDDGNQGEIQYLFRETRFNAIGGLAYAGVDRHFDRRVTIPPINFMFDASFHSKIKQPRGYLYGNLNLPDPVEWTLGISVDHYHEEALDVNKINPKLGVQWNITDDLLLRGSVSRTVKPALVANQTLEPTQVAGFNQFFDDINGTESWLYGVGLDWQLINGLFIGAEASWRDLTVPFFTDRDKNVVFDKQDEQTDRIYVHWLPVPELVISTEFVYDRFTSEQGVATDGFGFPKKLETVSVPVGARYFHPLGFFVGAAATYVHQNVDRTEASGGPDGDDSFTIVDLSVGYRFPKRFGIMSLSVSNLLDENFKYQDDDFREFQDVPTIGPYFPKRLILGRVTLSF